MSYLWIGSNHEKLLKGVVVRNHKDYRRKERCPEDMLHSALASSPDHAMTHKWKCDAWNDGVDKRHCKAAPALVLHRVPILEVPSSCTQICQQNDAGTENTATGQDTLQCALRNTGQGQNQQDQATKGIRADGRKEGMSGKRRRCANHHTGIQPGETHFFRQCQTEDQSEIGRFQILQSVLLSERKGL